MDTNTKAMKDAIELFYLRAYGADLKFRTKVKDIPKGSTEYEEASEDLAIAMDFYEEQLINSITSILKKEEA